MKLVDNLNIKSKLTLIIFLGVFATSIAGFLFDLYRDISSFKSDLKNNSLLHAKLISEYCVGPVDYGFKEETEAILEKMNAIPFLLNAAAFDQNNVKIGSFNRDSIDTVIPEIPIGESAFFEGEFLHVFHPISFKDRKIGTVYIRLSSELTKEIINHIYLMGGMSLGIILIALLIARNLQKIVSIPIVELERVTRKVTKESDYSIRLSRVGQDEISSLYNEFNVMLDTIQSRENERDIALNALKESEKKFRSYFEHSSVGFAVLSPDKKWREVNDHLCNMLELSRAELLNSDWIDLTHSEDHLIERRKFEDVKNGINDGFSLNKRFILKDDKIVYTVITANAFKNKADTIEYYIVLIQDITPQKKAEEKIKNVEEQLFHAQKLESIGKLAGGIAHDFNNILTGIMGYAELLKLQFGNSDSSEGQAAEVILSSSEKAASLTKQLLAFARGGKYNPIPLRVNEVIQETLTVSEKIFDKNVIFEKDLKDDIFIVDADKNQLVQVFTNLLINANDAMPIGGTIIIKSDNIVVNRDSENNSNVHLGEYAYISIKDSGIGMTRNIIDKIFDPFFTTKKEGEGTGLGLASVYGIIQNHDGNIRVESEPGKGTEFKILLPASDKNVQKIDTKKKYKFGDETVLVVDDEVYVRKLAAEQLEGLGYNVILAEDGREALLKYREFGSDIAVVLLDMIMPNLGGRDTFFELQLLNPDVKVIMMSGYSQEGKAIDIMEDGVMGFIQKPFRLHDLSNILSETLKQDEF